MFTLDLADLENLLASTTGKRPSEIVPMPGGASSRKFFRVFTNDGPSMVAMFVPDLDRADEIDNTGKRHRWPFLEIRDLLDQCGVRVPSLIADGTARGWTVVQDLGDYTVAAFLEKFQDAKPLIYTTAVRDLASAQQALAELPADSVVCTRAFDFTLLRWEIEHFREWALDNLGRPLPSSAANGFSQIADRLASRIAALPRGFVHRDYQSRNLMVVGHAPQSVQLAWVDFQDALMGPRVYDLVALLNDSYQTFSREFVDGMLDEFSAARGLSGQQREQLGLEFDLVTVQRKLKDAGRFVFIDRVKKDPSFLRFVEPTLAKVRLSLDRLSSDPDMRQLRQILGYVLD